MPGCNNCNHYTSELKWVNGEHIIHRSCQLENTKEMEQWWIDSGRLRPGDEGGYGMECHEFNDLTTSLMELNSTIGQFHRAITKLQISK